MFPWDNETQGKNLAWFLPRPKRDHYKGGMPLYAEEWLLKLAGSILGNKNPTILQIFCGMNKYGYRVDINPEVKPDLLYDAHKLTDKMSSTFDIVFADPPYSEEESIRLYKTGKLNYRKWTGEADKLLNPGGLLIVYHKYLMPNPAPERFTVEKRVFIANRSYHLARIAVFFRKKLDKD